MSTKKKKPADPFEVHRTSKKITAITVYYVTVGATPRIESFVATRADRNNFYNADDQWNPKSDCYLTKDQARRSKGLITKEEQRVLKMMDGFLKKNEAFMNKMESIREHDALIKQPK